MTLGKITVKVLLPILGLWLIYNCVDVSMYLYRNSGDWFILENHNIDNGKKIGIPVWKFLCAALTQLCMTIGIPASVIVLFANFWNTRIL